MKKIMLAAMIGTFSVASYAADEVLYILSAHAKLLEEPSFGSQTIASLTKGQKVVELEKNNNWFKVQYENKIGWMSRLAVSPNPPSKRSSYLADAKEDLSENARVRASTAATTAAVRGLRSDDRTRSADQIAGTNFEALAMMESIEVADDDVRVFLSDLK